MFVDIEKIIVRFDLSESKELCKMLEERIHESINDGFPSDCKFIKDLQSWIKKFKDHRILNEETNKHYWQLKSMILRPSDIICLRDLCYYYKSEILIEIFEKALSDPYFIK